MVVKINDIFLGSLKICVIFWVYKIKFRFIGKQQRDDLLLFWV